jgi:hypothetical protein
VVDGRRRELQTGQIDDRRREVHSL